MQVIRIVCLIHHFGKEQVDKLVESIFFRSDIVSPKNGCELVIFLFYFVIAYWI